MVFTRKGTSFNKMNLQPGEKISTTDFYADQELHKKFKQCMIYNPWEFLLTNSDKIEIIYDTIRVIDYGLLLMTLVFFLQIITYVRGPTRA